MLKLTVGQLETNCYILYDRTSMEAAIIDPGDEAERIAESLTQHRLTPRWFLLTHRHYDHIMALPALRTRYPDALTVIHKEDAEALTKPETALMPPKYYKDFHKPADREAKEGEVLSLGEHSIQWLHTPGHTKGSACLAAEHFLFTGDTLFVDSCGRVDLPGGDNDAMERSLYRLHQLPEQSLVFPGHGESGTLEAERQSNPYMKMAVSRLKAL